MSTVSLQDIVKGWSRKEINVSTIYKNEETGYCIQTIIDGETEDYIRLFKDNKTIAVKRKLLDDYSDWDTLMNHKEL